MQRHQIDETEDERHVLKIMTGVQHQTAPGEAGVIDDGDAGEAPRDIMHGVRGKDLRRQQLAQRLQRIEQPGLRRGAK